MPDEAEQYLKQVLHSQWLRLPETQAVLAELRALRDKYARLAEQTLLRREAPEGYLLRSVAIREVVEIFEKQQTQRNK